MLYLPYEDWFRLLLALGVGGLIGLEREMHAKAAGLRTITLITLGATLFTMLSLRFADDRVVANVVTGVGFLGAGAILLSEGRVRGLTTASSIWVSAALGMAIGMGEYALALSSTLAVVVVLWLFARIDRLVDVMGREIREYDVYYRSSPQKLAQMEALISACGLKIARRAPMKLGPDLYRCEWQLRGGLERHTRFVLEMLEDEEVTELRY